MSGSFADDDDSEGPKDITQYSYKTSSDKDQYNNNRIKDLPNSVDLKCLNKLSCVDENTKFSEVVEIPKHGKCIRYRDYGIRVLNKDVDNCGQDHPINTHVTVHCDGFRFVCNDRLTNMCPDHKFDVNDYSFLLDNKHENPSVLTVYFVNKHTEKDGELSCTDMLGYVFCPFRNPDGTPRLVKESDGVQLDCDGNPSPDQNTNGTFEDPLLIENGTSNNDIMEKIICSFKHKKDVVSVSEDLVHQLGHQSGLLHTSEDVEDEDMRRDEIVRVMYRKLCKKDKKCDKKCRPRNGCDDDKERLIRRVLTPKEWCILRSCGYLVRTCKGQEHYFANELN